ncbi:hypothetical protein TNCV_3395591 [Trichonephila clavipes]|nr:hypothetical protein TNCV_3395591 [Trichonephila clavipes]
MGLSRLKLRPALRLPLAGAEIQEVSLPAGGIIPRSRFPTRVGTPLVRRQLLGKHSASALPVGTTKPADRGSDRDPHQEKLLATVQY